MNDDHSDILGKDGTKILSMFILGVGSFFFGMIPGCLTRQNQRRYPLLITILLCFGAGVLLATAIVHMLAEVKEDLPKYAEIIFCVGFFIVYIADELVHYYCGRGHRHNPETSNRRTSLNGITGNETYPSGSTTSITQYGSDQETQTLLGKRTQQMESQPTQLTEPIHSSDDEGRHLDVCSTIIEESNEQNLISIIGLLTALSLHSFLEGLAIGVQKSATKVFLLLVAVSSHKFVVAFCLGIEVSANANAKFRNHLIVMLVFSMGSVMGIGIGMGLVDFKQSLTDITIPILQALAGGTLLYVTVCEVLPREKYKWQHNTEQRGAGLMQLAAVICGFTVMTLLNEYLDD